MRIGTPYQLCDVHQKAQDEHVKKVENRTVLWGDFERFADSILKCSDCKPIYKPPLAPDEEAPGIGDS